MSKKVWGPTIWILLHSLCELIKDEYFLTEKNNLVAQIKNICYNLPCPTCTNHAISILKRIKLEDVKTKSDLIHKVWVFHNIVNKNTKKPFVDKDILDQYKRARLDNILYKVKTTYKSSFLSSKYIMYKFHGQKAFYEFLKYMHYNKDKFTFI